MKKRILSLLLTAVIAATAFAGCQTRDSGAESGADNASSKPSSSDSSGASSDKTVSAITGDMLEQVEIMKGENEDSVGWLRVPGTTIDDVVVQKADDKTNSYYLRLDFNKLYNFNGVYYADFRSAFGDGSRDQLANNICIYGHSLTDNPEDERYDLKFAPLHEFRDPELAKAMPYILLSTEKENLAYEVMAVFVANADNTKVPYNRGDMEQAEFIKMVKEEILPRSIYNYDVEIGDDDKFITLSTCIYKLQDGTPTNYPKTQYRYAIMARLVDSDSPLREEATFTINETPLVDPDGKMAS